VTDNDKRLIEDYLPIDAISEEAVREKSVRQGHISTLHLWWARRPLVAARAAVYGTLVHAPKDPKGRGGKSQFVQRLCKHPGDPRVFAEARKHVLEAHAARTKGVPGGSERPKVLDLFAGGGAIPLEVSRLGGDAYALELNPVGYLIELCTLVYPQKYGKPDTGTVGAGRDKMWAGLVEEVRTWGTWALGQARKRIADLYPLAKDPECKGRREAAPRELWNEQVSAVPNGYLLPVAYLWTRTVRCKKPGCGGAVPLARQTWLCRKEYKGGGGRYIALRKTWDRREKRV